MKKIPDGAWLRNLATHAALIRRLGRRPSGVSDDPLEKRAAQWLNLQRKLQRLPHRSDGPTQIERLRAQRIAALSRALGPMWGDRIFVTELDKDTWNTRLDQLVAFVAQHERLPRKIAEDAAEKSLGRWLFHQRQASRGKGTAGWSDARREALDLHVPTWRGERQRENRDQDLWERTFAEIQRYVQAQGRLPARTHENDTEEIRLIAWLGTQRQAARGAPYDGWDKAKERLLDSELQDWR